MAGSAVARESLDSYLQWLLIEKGRALATLEAYQRDVVHYLDWCALVDVDALSAREKILEKYLAEQRGHGASPATVNRTLSAIKGWYGFLLDDGVILTDPAQSVTSHGRRKGLPKPITEEAVSRFLDIALEDDLDYRDQAIFEFLYSTGCRVSELVSCDISDVDFDEELIRLTGKGSKQRLVPLGRHVVRALQRYLPIRGRLLKQDQHALFVNSRGGRLTRQGIDLLIHRRALRSGVDASSLSAHVFRHSCATHMLANGADIRVVQELLGHASISTTQVYTGVSIRTLRDTYTAAHPRAHS
jgi:integrase/recombinase XerD